MSVNVIFNGQMMNVDEERLDEARAHGAKLPSEIMAMSHPPDSGPPTPGASHEYGANLGVQGPKPGVMDAFIHGASGVLGPYAAAAGGVPVGNSFAGLQARPEQAYPGEGFQENLGAANAERKAAYDEHPLAATAGSFLSPESLSAGQVGTAAKNAGKAANLSRGLRQGIRNFRPMQAVKVASPTRGEAITMAASGLGASTIGIPGLGVAGALPWMTRVATDPRVNYQMSRVAYPALGRSMGPALDFFDAENK